MTSKNLKNST